MNKLHILRLLNNNYCYILINGNNSVAVDPGESEPVLEFLRKKNLILDSIMLTHAHKDHCGGVKKLQKVYPAATLIDNRSDNISIFNNTLQINIINTPGHTADSCCFHLPDIGVLFTGDTLFTGLCGKILQGTYKELFESIKSLRELPGSTRIFPGHEYLKNSINFISSIGKDTTFYRSLLKMQNPALNSTIATEIVNNPFMTEDFTRFRELRILKNT